MCPEHKNIVLFGVKSECENFVKSLKSIYPFDMDLYRGSEINHYNVGLLKPARVYDIFIVGPDDFDVEELPYVNVIIYLSPPEQQSQLITKKCIAIDFKALKIEPSECIDLLPNFIKQYDHEIKEHEKAMNSAMLAQALDLSPSEKQLASLSTVASPLNFDNPAQPIYVGLPSKPVQEDVVEIKENKAKANKSDTKDVGSSACTLF